MVKNTITNLRLKSEQYEEIKRKAKDKGLCFSEYARRRICDGEPEEIELLKQILREVKKK